MSGNPIYDYVTSTAVSLTMAGNTGISPFLTLFLLGVIEMVQPEWLNMGPTMELLLASWWSIAVLGTLAVAELVGKCIPAVDEVIDSAEVFVVPVISVLATMATMGLLPVSEGAHEDAGLGQNIDVIGLFDGNDAGVRYLEEVVPVDPDAASDAFGEGFLTFTKVVLVIAGVGLSLAIHFFKMIVRMSSLACSGGCCQPCITIVEYFLVIVGVILALLAPAFAVIASIAFLGFAAYVIWKKCSKKKSEDTEEEDAARGNNGKIGNNQNDDVEDQSPTVKDSPNPPAEAFAVIDGLVDVPLAPTAPKDWDVEAKVY